MLNYRRVVVISRSDHNLSGIRVIYRFLPFHRKISQLSWEVHQPPAGLKIYMNILRCLDQLFLFCKVFFSPGFSWFLILECVIMCLFSIGRLWESVGLWGDAPCESARNRNRISAAAQRFGCFVKGSLWICKSCWKTWGLLGDVSET